MNTWFVLVVCRVVAFGIAYVGAPVLYRWIRGFRSARAGWTAVAVWTAFLVAGYLVFSALRPPWWVVFAGFASGLVGAVLTFGSAARRVSSR